MNIPQHESQAPDKALVTEFNTFVAEHTGSFAMQGAVSALIETYSRDDADGSHQTGYVVEITEPLEADGKTHNIYTDYHSYGGFIMKSCDGMTHDELQSVRAKIQQSELEKAVESALIGSDDENKITESLVFGKIATSGNLDSLLAALSASGPQEYPASAAEITTLLADLRNAVGPQRAG